MSKPREFWISWKRERASPYFETFITTIEPSLLNPNDDFMGIAKRPHIHVIEYIAYEASLEKIVDIRTRFEFAREELKKSVADVALLKEALEYYASDKNWYGPGAPFNEDNSRKMIIASVDTEGNNWLGGRTARLALKKLNDSEGGR